MSFNWSFLNGNAKSVRHCVQSGNTAIFSITLILNFMRYVATKNEFNFVHIWLFFPSIWKKFEFKSENCRVDAVLPNFNSQNVMKIYTYVGSILFTFLICQVQYTMIWLLINTFSKPAQRAGFQKLVL